MDAARPWRERWSRAVVVWLRARGATPNRLSWSSVVFAMVAGLSLMLALREPPASAAALLVIAAVAMQARLASSRLDGLLATYARLRGRAGEVYNDAPDRAADALVFVGLGYGLAPTFAWGVDLGWAAALLALSTAYVRVLGVACGLPERADGLMPRRRRMAVMSVAALIAAVLVGVGETRLAAWALAVATALVATGAAVTAALRLRAIVHRLEAR
ncbi:CDP-alcohol phosphatidyltransferase family protein [Lysobacter psychrotolerans]|uniref:CDP-alcohol phosphatidyltransferase family protein n=1 Tax=Montanilutibacter psychrotolerans TaxID=1327343 RepID=A0A3M8SS27_9GAMM|nr:CDP-alcohol phosphatidyltransferase family protein [Lysobacter psychrotolerans]